MGHGRGLLCLAGLMGLLLCGCVSVEGVAPAAVPGMSVPAKVLTVPIDDKGIAAGEFLSSEEPPILAPNGELIFQDQTSGKNADVTLLLEIPVEAMRSYLKKPDLEQAALINEFEQRIKGEMRLLDVDCDRAPRCEATVDLSRNQEARVSSRLLALDGAKVTPFYVLIASDDAEKPSGYVTLATKLRPALEIPLDNTGIADFGFLNPRSPKFLPGEVMQFEARVQRPAQSPQSSLQCVFRAKATTDSSRRRPPIPTEDDHPFQSEGDHFRGLRPEGWSPWPEWWSSSPEWWSRSIVKLWVRSAW